MSDVKVYSIGLVHISVCAGTGLSKAEVEAGATLEHPTGLDHGWRVSEDGEFSDETPNPAPCNTDPGRLHWLMEC